MHNITKINLKLVNVTNFLRRDELRRCIETNLKLKLALKIITKLNFNASLKNLRQFLILCLGKMTNVFLSCH